MSSKASGSSKHDASPYRTGSVIPRPHSTNQLADASLTEAAMLTASRAMMLPHILLTTNQLIFSGLAIIAKFALKDGAQPLIFALYREVLASLMMAAFVAYRTSTDSRPVDWVAIKQCALTQGFDRALALLDENISFDCKIITFYRDPEIQIKRYDFAIKTYVFAMT
jgi:hypothetical protein